MKQLLESNTEAHKPNRYFLARIDGRPTWFTLHHDRSITVAPVAPESARVESLEDVQDERWPDDF